MLRIRVDEPIPRPIDLHPLPYEQLERERIGRLSLITAASGSRHLSDLGGAAAAGGASTVRTG
ncbi:hypothetical protein [Rathayibacter sp. VKM Ac-2801]|uniref:hypothetical protein n=1 Tax=Rathayibacter sp. VKM Ac-2801 TaxID=2609255 RepID=UPI00131F9FB8|nr:hypothetical protein [Rathayibacter sp. VKM Ac-2801]QHC69972.1 hypothetical protein GSU45_06015 [Rathayibacter sp. VKM Ac-2801]